MAFQLVRGRSPFYFVEIVRNKSGGGVVQSVIQYRVTRRQVKVVKIEEILNPHVSVLFNSIPFLCYSYQVYRQQIPVYLSDLIPTSRGRHPRVCITRLGLSAALLSTLSPHTSPPRSQQPAARPLLLDAVNFFIFPSFLLSFYFLL